jgi:hypothetical protein
MNANQQPKSANFNFLAKRYPDLERIGALCERYFSDDPICVSNATRILTEVRRWLKFKPVCGTNGTNQDTDTPFKDGISLLDHALRAATEPTASRLGWLDGCEQRCFRIELTH